MIRSLHLHLFRFASMLVFSSLCALCASTAMAHGGVVYGEDRCLININFMQAHFTVFQPETRDNKEFCESIPDVTRSVFVMEYLHQLLPEMAIDFRIIEDADNLGRFADWEDIKQITDLDAVTVFYERPRIESGGYYRASYSFENPGTYIGIVTASHPTEARDYNAVFYFRVGGPDLGTIPLFILLLVVMQTGYWLSNGGMAKLKSRFGQPQFPG